MNLQDISAHKVFGRKPNGMAAMLLPYEADGRIAVEAFGSLIRETLDAGLTPAVNMDTGYANLLSEAEKLLVLGLARESSDGKPFIAGAYIEGVEGDVTDLYRHEIERIVRFGGTPILFQTSRLHGAPPKEVAHVYGRAVAGCDVAYAFELGQMFAPNGEIWPLETVERVMEIPEIKGMKHSSLDRLQEIERLQLRDRVRPDFMILTGNDLGIDMIEYGSDYLLGLAAFSPSSFAERDRRWAAGDPSYLDLADALQHLGNVAFRPPVPAYKHSCATFLHRLGKIPTPNTHPRSPSRPPWESEIMLDCAYRLGLLRG